MSIIFSMIQILIYVAALVVAIMLRGRDGRAALFLAIGVGCQALAVLVIVGKGLAMSAMLDSSLHASPLHMSTLIIYGFDVVSGLIRLAGFALIFMGLLRLVRRPGVARAGMGVAR